MTHPCEIIADAAVGNSSFPTGRKMVFGEVGVCADSVIGNRASHWGDHAHGTDTYTYIRSSTFGDIGICIDAFSPLNNALVEMFDGCVVSDSFVVARSFNLSDHAHYVEGYTPARMFVLKEHGVTVETYTAHSHYKMVMNDLVSALEKYTCVRSTTMSDHAHGAELFTISRTTIMAEHAIGTALFKAIGLLTATMAEHGIAHDAMTNKLAAKMTMTEEGCLDDTYVIPGPVDGLSAPTDNLGMSRYDGLLVNSVAGSDAGLVGAGPAGIYAFDTPGLDVGAKYNAFVLTSVWDGGKATMKRYGYMYTGLSMVDVTGLGPYDPDTNPGGYMYALDVIDWQDGDPVTTTYLPEPGPVGGYVSRRHKVGRGRRSFYFQHRFHFDGLEFAFDDARGMVDLLTRKV